MSLPKQLYDVYKQICQCPLVQNWEVTDETLAEFQQLLNAAQPASDNVEGNAQRTLTKAMYHSNPIGFMQYVSVRRNRVSALILWTESKRIVRFFELQGRVHLSWDSAKQQYVASRHVRQSNSSAHDEDDQPVARQGPRSGDSQPSRGSYASRARTRGDFKRGSAPRTARRQYPISNSPATVEDANPFEPVSEEHTRDWNETTVVDLN